MSGEQHPSYVFCMAECERPPHRCLYPRTEFGDPLHPLRVWLVQRPDSLMPLNWNLPAMIGPKIGKHVTDRSSAPTGFLINNTQRQYTVHH
jgi:hypothetical protein